MNKKYTRDLEGNIKVITEKGEVIEKEYPYTKNTDEILSIENFIENLQTKVNIFRNESNKAKKQKKDSRKIIIIIPMLIFIISIILTITLLPPLEYLPLIVLSLLGVTTILEIPFIIKNIKSSNRIETCDSKIDELTYQINKAQKRINALLQDKTVIEDKPVEELIEVKNDYNFYFDPEDYFVEKYRIDKRAREILKQQPKGKKKVRKPSKENTNIYEF